MLGPPKKKAWQFPRFHAEFPGGKAPTVVLWLKNHADSIFCCSHLHLGVKIGHPHHIPSHGSSSFRLRTWSQMGVYKPLPGPNHIHVGCRIWFQQDFCWGLKIIFRPSFMIPSDQYWSMPFGHGHWAWSFSRGFPSRMRRRLWKHRRRRGHLEKMEHSRQNQRFVGTNAEVIVFFLTNIPWISMNLMNWYQFELFWGEVQGYRVLTPSSSRFQATRMWYLTRKGTESVLCIWVTPPKIQIGQQFGYLSARGSLFWKPLHRSPRIDLPFALLVMWPHCCGKSTVYNSHRWFPSN